MRNRFPVTLWLTLVALVAALALPARANTGPFPRRAAGWWVRISFMWYRMTAVRWKRLPRSTMSASPALLQANPGVDPYVPRAGSVLTIPPADAAARCAARRAGDKPRRTAPLLLPAGQK